jgi:hypothetical protein
VDESYFLQHTPAWRIFDSDIGADPVKIERIESEFDKTATHFGGVALAPIFGRYPKTQTCQCRMEKT